jgi:hypothetical protein
MAFPNVYLDQQTPGKAPPSSGLDMEDMISFEPMDSSLIFKFSDPSGNFTTDGHVSSIVGGEVGTRASEPFVELDNFINYDPDELTSITPADESIQRTSLNPFVSNPSPKVGMTSPHCPNDNNDYIGDHGMDEIESINLKTTDRNKSLVHHSHSPHRHISNFNSNPRPPPRPAHSAHPSSDFTKLGIRYSPHGSPVPRRRSQSMPPSAQPSSPNFQRRLNGQNPGMAPISNPPPISTSVPIAATPRSHPYFTAKRKRYTGGDAAASARHKPNPARLPPHTPSAEDMRVLDGPWDPVMFCTPVGTPVGTPFGTPRVEAREMVTARGYNTARGYTARLQIERVLATARSMDMVRRDALMMMANDGDLKESVLTLPPLTWLCWIC